MKVNVYKLVATIGSIVILFMISILFTVPVFTGKQLKQYDIIQHKGMSKEIIDYREKGERVLWTESMFSGMPAYMVETKYDGSALYYLNAFFRNILPHPASLILMMLLGFYVLMLAMKIDPLTALIGAVAFAFSTYFIIVITAGHNAKVHAVAYLPAVFAGLYVAYRRNIWTGTALFTLFFALELMANHPQMTYYFGFFIAFFIFVEFIGSLAEKKFMHFLKATALIVFGAFLAVGSHWGYLKTTLDYGKYSIRGTSELTSNAENKTKGLDRDYVTQWSHGIGETMTFLIPDYKGGASDMIGNNKDVMKKVDGQYKQIVGNMPTYWGDQPGVSGPVYVGAFILLLFVFSLIAVKDRIKWAILAVTILTIMLSWGKNYMGLTNFFLDYFPGYDKFRAVSSIMIIPEFTIPLLAILGLAAFTERKDFFDSKVTIFTANLGFDYKTLFLGVSGIFILYTLMMWIAPGSFTNLFAAGEYDELKKQFLGMGASEGQISDILGEVEAARAQILKADALRSLIILILGSLSVILYAYLKFNKYILIAILFLIVTIDMFTVNKRYMSEKGKDYVEVKKGMGDLIPETTADRLILADPALSYRVLNLTKSPFNDATTSYRHNSIGGYHGAKLKKYQELIENRLIIDMEGLNTVFKPGVQMYQIDSALSTCGGLNMLNTKYIIIDENSAPLVNNYALGNAWFVKEYKIAENADEEMKTLIAKNPANTAVLDKDAAAIVGSMNIVPDSTARIYMTSYHPEKLEYQSESKSEGLAVFSEIYYAEGWEASIDGQPAQIMKADYVLRGLKIPAGKHKVEFVFKPRFWKDQKISFGFSIALLLFCGLLSFKPAKDYITGKKPEVKDSVKNS